MTQVDSPMTVAVLERDEDSAALRPILESAFGMKPRDSERYERIVERKNFRILRDGEQVVGGLAIIPMGQCFGGRGVPMAGIAAVGIAPWVRGRGAARTLMTNVLKSLRKDGFAISTLYPATQTLYRTVGYEVAGSQYEIAMPLDQINVREKSLIVRPITPEDEPTIEAMHAAHALEHAGNLQRNNFLWTRIRKPRGKTSAGFLCERDGAIEGYAYYAQRSARNKPYSLNVHDILATTPAAIRQLLAFLGDHRSVGEEAIWQGSPIDPVIAAMPENAWKIRLKMHWMVRMLDVKVALEKRGYASCASGELHLDIADDVLTENAGKWTLRVEQGKATVAPGGNGSLRMSARALSPLYTGFMTARDLATLGWLEARDAQTLALAIDLFAGPAPWMSDGF